MTVWFNPSSVSKRFDPIKPATPVTSQVRGVEEISDFVLEKDIAKKFYSKRVWVSGYWDSTKSRGLQVFSWVDARLSRTQPRGTRTRKRMNRSKSITFSGKQNPRYLAFLSTKSQYFSSSTSSVSLSTSTKRTSGMNCQPRKYLKDH